MKLAWITVLVLGIMGQTVHAQEVRLHAAGSLKAALSDISDAFEKQTGATVLREFGPSGLLRERIEGGEAAEVFASANMRHPQILADAGLAGPVTMFARNRLCALAQPEVDIDTDMLLKVILSDDIRLGTSTPKADPAGDYAWAMFARAEDVEPGAQATLETKASQLTGGPDSAKPPSGRNPYAWVMDEGQADVFLTYCTNAVLAQREVLDLQIVQLPDNLAVGADYGLTVLTDAPTTAEDLARFILALEAQQILAGYGFESPK